MKVFLAGATGAIGRLAVPVLLEAGQEVTAVARSDDKARGLAEQGATPVRVSIFDHEALVPAFAGHDAVVNIATHIPPVRQSGACPPGPRTTGSAGTVPRPWPMPRRQQVSADTCRSRSPSPTGSGRCVDRRGREP
jgi:hypothetical protein